MKMYTILYGDARRSDKEASLGDGLLPTTDVGPCINEVSEDRAILYRDWQKEGARLVCGGNIAVQGDLAKVGSMNRHL